MTVARRRRGTIPERRREPSREWRASTLHRVAAPAALADGGLHPGHVVHWRGHGVHRHAEISELVSIHKPLGIAILVLALVRLVVRLGYGAPSLPADLPEPMKLAAHLSHYAFYVLMIAMPLIGWGMLSAAAYPVVLFGGVHLPAILPQSDSLHALLWNAHFYLAFAFFALILLHVAAALFHALVRREGVFEAMASVSTDDGVTPAE